MKVTVYTREENLEELNKRLMYPENSNPVSKELFTTENAQRTHFQGWAEVQIDYNDYVRLKDLML